MKYYRITVKKVANGYIVEAAYKTPKKDVDDYFNYNEDINVFSNWEDVIKYIEANELTTEIN